MYHKRRHFLDEILGEKSLRGIEIGALDKPLVVKNDLSPGSEILYADHLSTEGLRKKYKLDRTVDQKALVDVDLVCPSGEFLEALNGQAVDYIVASHVVEHVPNPIHWLQGLFEVLRPGGSLFLVVPDKRFTFDYQRPATTFGAMLQSYLSCKKIPSVSDVFDHYSTAVLIDGGKVWSGSLGMTDLIPLTSHENAFKYAQQVHEEDAYHDVHVSIFTPFSFFAIIERLIQTELLMTEISAFRDTDLNDIEFLVCLKKPKLTKKGAVKTACLASIPSLNIETLVSPYMPQVKSLSVSLEEVTRSNSKLETQLENLNNELISLRNQNSTLNKVLARRSIKFMMIFSHYFFSIFSFLRRER